MVVVRPVEFQSWPANPLRDVFTTQIIAHWKRSPTKELIERCSILEAEGIYPSTRAVASKVRYWRARRAAWETYLTAAFACGLMDGIKGKELRARLCDRDEDNFRSALAECLTCWYLAGKRKLPINPLAPGRGEKHLEMVVFDRDQSIGVEVKAPHQEESLNGISWGDGSDKIEAAVSKANKQFDEKGPNLLVITPNLRLQLCHHRSALARALYGQSKITIPISRETGTAISEARVEFFPDGKLFKRQKSDGSPGYRRISALLCIEECGIEAYPSWHFADARLIPSWWPEAKELHDSAVNRIWIEHNAIVLHNPFAYYPIDYQLFSDIPQCLPNGDVMRWTDGHDATV